MTTVHEAISRACWYLAHRAGWQRWKIARYTEMPPDDVDCYVNEGWKYWRKDRTG